MRWQPGEPVKLKTDRYVLRSLETDDATEQYLSWLNDPVVNKFMVVRFQESSIETIQAYIESHDNRSSFLLGIFDKENEQHVGNCSARCDLYHQTADLGVMIGDREHWGRRTVLEARAAVLEFLFTQVDIFKAHGACYAINAPAVYNYKSQGYVLEGVLKSHRVIEGKRVDVVQFGMFREDWLAKR